MGKWIAIGVDKSTGNYRELEVDADDEAQATRRANRRGVMVEEVRPHNAEDTSDGLAALAAAVPQQYAPPPPIRYQHGSPQVIHHHHHSDGGAAYAILSFFIPGLGQLCSGRAGTGILFFVGTFIGMFLLIIPGLVIWIWSIIDAANGSKR